MPKDQEVKVDTQIKDDNGLNNTDDLKTDVQDAVDAVFNANKAVKDKKTGGVTFLRIVGVKDNCL